MEVKLYQVDGKKYNVSADREQDFLTNFPNAVLLGKIQGSPESATEESTQAQQQETQAQPQEEETPSSGDSSQESGDLGSPEDYEPAAKTAKDAIDFREMITVVDKDEDEVVNAFLNSPQFPGIGIEKAGFMFGNAVRIQLPDGTNKYVDLKGDHEEAKKALEEVKEWYASNGDDPRVAMGDILGRRYSSSTASGETHFDTDELPSMNKALKSAGYTIKNHAGRYKLMHNGEFVKDEEGNLFVGDAPDIQSYVWNNVTDEELSGLREYAKGKGETLTAEAMTKKEEFYLDQTDEDSLPKMLNEGFLDTTFAGAFEEAGISSEDQNAIQEFLDTDITKTIEMSGGYGPDGRVAAATSQTIVDKESRLKRHKQLKQAIESGEVQLSEAGKEEVLNLLSSGGKLDINNLADNFPGEFNRYKQGQASELAGLYLEQRFKDDPDMVAIRSHFDGTTSKYTVEEEYEPFKQRGEALTKEFNAIKANFDSEIDSWEKDLEGTGLGVKVFGEGETMQIIVHGENENKRRAMQTRIDKIISNQKKESSKLLNAQDVYQKEFNSWVNDNQETSFVSNAINKEFDTWTVMGEDFRNGFKDMVYGVGAMFGSEGAMDAMDSSQAGQIGMETMLTWDQASALGEKVDLLAEQ